MSLTSRKKRPLNRQIPHLRDTKLIIIATEGEKTEKQYFESDLFRSNRVQVKVLETVDGHSAPTHVLKRIRKYKKEYELNDNDQLWLMFDKDNWDEHVLAQIYSEAKRSLRSIIHLAVSNPCFELWLLLHHINCTDNLRKCNDVEIKLREILGSYNKSNINIKSFANGIDKAIERAKDLDTGNSSTWPNHPGTHVYKVVKEILKLKTV